LSVSVKFAPSPIFGGVLFAHVLFS
jgi:hypothetical protein